MRLATLAPLGGLVLGFWITGAEPQAGQRPRLSPHESVSGTVDGSEITVTYGRPSMRGRVIFGTLVPYGRVWCPGADEATTLDSSRQLQLGDLVVPPGPHTIWLLPTPDVWTLIVSRDAFGFHTNYHPDSDLGRTPLRRRQLDAPVEQLTFFIEKGASGSGGSILIRWETTEVSVPFVVQ
jgi:hypothetical protein